MTAAPRGRKGAQRSDPRRPERLRRPDSKGQATAYDDGSEYSYEYYSDYESWQSDDDSCSSRTFSLGRDLSISSQRSLSPRERRRPAQSPKKCALPSRQTAARDRPILCKEALPRRGRVARLARKERRRPRSVANSEDYGELKDFLDARARGERTPPRQGIVRRRSPDRIARTERRCVRKRVRLTPAKAAVPEKPERTSDGTAKTLGRRDVVDDWAREPNDDWRHRFKDDFAPSYLDVLCSSSPRKERRAAPLPTDVGELRTLIRNIKTTTYRREFEKRREGFFGRYKKDRTQRIADRESRSRIDPYSVLFSHISRRVPEDYLRKLFDEVAPVSKFQLLRGSDGISLGRGKCTFKTTEDAKKATRQLSGWYVFGRTMRVTLFRPDALKEGIQEDKGKKPCKPCAVIFTNANSVSTEGFLRWLFAKAGTILSFSLRRSDSGNSLGKGTCLFDSVAAAEHAIERFDGGWVDNRKLVVYKDPSPPKNPAACVFFHNVCWTTKEQDLRRRFESFGTVEAFELRVKGNGRSLGMGTCWFKYPRQACDAIAALNGKELDGRKLYLSVYDPTGANRSWEAEVKEEPESDCDEDAHPAWKESRLKSKVQQAAKKV